MNMKTRPAGFRIRRIAAPLLLFLSCSDIGGPHLEKTGVEVLGPRQFKIYFSEPLSEYNNTVAGENGSAYFVLINASTLDTLPLDQASPADQELTLSLKAPSVMTAGHAYKVYFDVSARDNPARATGDVKFTADYPPPADWLLSPLQAARDSLNRLLFVWKPDNRLGNSVVKMWRKRLISQRPETTLVAQFRPQESAFWMEGAAASESFALQAVNPYGESLLKSWVTPAPQNLSIDTAFFQVRSVDTTLMIRILELDTVKKYDFLKFDTLLVDTVRKTFLLCDSAGDTVICDDIGKAIGIKDSLIGVFVIVDTVRVQRVFVDTLRDDTVQVDTTLFDTTKIDTSILQPADFTCEGKCLNRWQPQGFVIQEKYSDCNHVEYFRASDSKTLVRDYGLTGVTESLLDSNFALISTVTWTWKEITASQDTFCVK